MKTLPLFVLVLSLQHLKAQELTLPLWPEGKIPGYKKTNDVEKRDTGEIIRISNVQIPEITVYRPSKRTANGQAVIICPGGGYTYLSYNWEGSDPARLLSAKGITAIVLKYRLPNAQTNPESYQYPLQDAQRAIRLVRFYAEKWNIHKDRVGIMGFSAGGHLASTAGTHFDNGNPNSPDSVEQQSSRPDFLVLVYPVISMSKNIMHKGSKNRLIGEKADETMAKLYSNELQVTKETPPSFLVHATDDKTVPVENSLLFYQALKDNNIPAELHVFPKGGHGFGLGIGKGAAETWTDLCLEWLRNLGK